MPKLKGKVLAKERQKKRKRRATSLESLRKDLIAKIRKHDDPILKEVCTHVDRVEGQKIGKEMIRVLLATKNGVGLAACQIGYAKNIIAIVSDSMSRKINIMLNPVIVEKSETIKSGMEGCLSYPDVYGLIERYETVTVEFTDMNFIIQKETYKNMEAVIVQHECEHLQEGMCEVGKKWKESQKK